MVCGGVSARGGLGLDLFRLLVRAGLRLALSGVRVRRLGLAFRSFARLTVILVEHYLSVAELLRDVTGGATKLCKPATEGTGKVRYALGSENDERNTENY